MDVIDLFARSAFYPQEVKNFFTANPTNPNHIYVFADTVIAGIQGILSDTLTNNAPVLFNYIILRLLIQSSPYLVRSFFDLTKIRFKGLAIRTGRKQFCEGTRRKSAHIESISRLLRYDQFKFWCCRRLSISGKDL